MSPEAPPPSSHDAGPGRHLVVGIGCSAGSLEPLREVLGRLPADLDASVLVVQHVGSKEQEELLIKLLDEATELPVAEAADAATLETGRVYVAPPHCYLELDEGDRLRVQPLEGSASPRMPIDHFFRSLATAAHQRAVGVVLSGGGSDGSAGLREIAGSAGVTLVQDPDGAARPEMPRAAIALGTVDLVLPPAEIADRIDHLARHHDLIRSPREEGEQPALEGARLGELVSLLRSASGIDFSGYKRGTLGRRLQRRMTLRRASSLEDYLDMLREEPDEAHALSQDILINVTEFFRAPEAFDALQAEVLPAIVEGDDDGPIRMWVAGCATGEEAYSVAITLAEFLEDCEIGRGAQIFATDVSEAAVERARRGTYPRNIVESVSAERLRRFFKEDDGALRVRGRIRDLCVFSQHDLTRDPPFSRLDLLVCRNVLIYFDRALQERLASTFHYALRPGGFLMLGESEALNQPELFATVDKKTRLLRRKGGDRVAARLPAGSDRPASVKLPTSTRQRDVDPGAGVDRLLLERYSPAAVLVNDEGRILLTRGRTAPYLELPSGEPNLELLKMARGTLGARLRAALAEARDSGLPVRMERLPVDVDGGQRVDVVVRPMRRGDELRFLVVFEESRRPDGAPSAAPDAGEEPEDAATGGDAEDGPGGRDADSPRVEELERELRETRRQMQATIQDLEAANEELLSANEEILSSNEELQSTNEELDTAKEELQSTNEELNTLNDELQARNAELNRANADLVNVLKSVEIAIVIVDRELRIRRFTPKAEEVLNLRPGDVDRPLTHIKPNLEIPDLAALVDRVADEVAPLERDVQDAEGRWYSLRIRPYKDLDERIDGAVISLFDIEQAKRHEARVAGARDFAEAVIATVRQPLVVLDGELKVQMANRAFLEAFALKPSEMEGKRLYDLGEGGWDIPELRRQLEEALSEDRPFTDFSLEHDFPRVGTRELTLSARRMPGDGGRHDLVLMAIDDVTRTPENR